MNEIIDNTEIVFTIRMRRDGTKRFFDVLKKELEPVEEKCLKDFIRRQIIEEEGLKPFEGDFYLK